MKKRLIVHNGNISIGGQEKMLIEFLKLLDSNKYEVLLLIEENNGKRNDYIDEIPKWIEYKFLTTEKFMMNLEKNKRSKNPIRKFFYSLQLKRKKIIAINELKKYLDFSNIIIDYDMGLIRNLHRLDLKNKTLVGWSHAGEGAPLKSKRKRENIERYDYIVAINEVMKKGHKKNTKHPKIVKIYNCMDFSKIKELSREKIEENIKNYIVSVGSLTENKNHKLLIESFSKLKKEKKIEEKLVILGEGKEREKLEELIEKLNLKEEIILLGQKKNPYKYILNSKLFVLPSKNEGLPLTLLETLCLGKMIIAVENNGSKEILGTKYGVLVENNEDQLSEKIFYYLNNIDKRVEFEKLSQKRMEEFSVNKVKSTIEEFIDKL